MLIEIQDDFDLGKIASSGQCFRIRKSQDDTYHFIIGDDVIYMRDEGNRKFYVSCNADKWENMWSNYFDLDRYYGKIFEEECNKHPFIHKAMTYGRGLRILRQNPWETLITFILSQRKSIPAISKSVEMLAIRYGHGIKTACETVYSFPTEQEMAGATEHELAECGIGYRAKYVIDATRRILAGEIDLDAMHYCSDEQLLETLQKINGVGGKVANCVALFAYGRTGCVPIDIWISRAIENDCEGQSPFDLFGQNAGIIQQYVFYYEKRRQHSIS